MEVGWRVSWHQPAVEAETQRPGISLSVSVSVSLSLRELRRVRWRPLPTSPTSPWALLSLAAPGALRALVQPPTHRTGQGRMRDRRGLGLASGGGGVLSEGPAHPPGSDRLAPPSCSGFIAALLDLASAAVSLPSPTPTQLEGRFPALKALLWL